MPREPDPTFGWADRSIVPSTVKTARIAAGLTISALASECGITEPTLSRMENGRRPATTEEAEAIAHALQLPIDALCRPLVSERLGLSGFYHRKMSRASARRVQQIESRCLLDIVALHELIGIADIPTEEDVPTIHPDEIGNDIEKAANVLRLKWGIPRGPIADLTSIIERAGCLVIHQDFGIPEMDALYQKARGVPPVFWVNSRKPLDRVRFSLSHELGHLVLHEDCPVDIGRAENEANAFAGAFLMPRAEFLSECPPTLGIEQLVELKRRWRCSMASIVRRACDVQAITQQHRANLMSRLTKLSWRKQEPYPITGETPRFLCNLLETCIHRFGFTEEDLADRLAVPVQQVNAWRQSFPGQRQPNGSADAPRLRLTNGF